jgi:hypothetical protein
MLSVNEVNLHSVSTGYHSSLTASGRLWPSGHKFLESLYAYHFSDSFTALRMSRLFQLRFLGMRDG